MIATSWSVTTSGSRSTRKAAICSRRSSRTCRHQARGNGSPGPMAARMFHVTRRRPPRAAATPPLTRSLPRLLDRAREEPLAEVPLKAEQHGERHEHQEEGRRREEVPLRSVRSEEGRYLDRHREIRFLADEDEGH